MIAETPLALCTKGATAYRRKQMADARKVARLCPRARVVGVAFFDFIRAGIVEPNAEQMKARDIGIQLDNDRTFRVLHRSNAWSKNRHVLDDSRYSHVRKHVGDAHARTDALDQSTADRYNAARQDEVNDPSWQRLTEGEKSERHTALAATKKA
jgi:hypothetical protein